MPGDTPSLVTPSLEKQDIPQMQRDLSKYDAAGVYNAEAVLSWEKLLTELPNKYGSLPEPEPPWIIEELRPSVRVQDCGNKAVLPEKVSKNIKAAQERHKVTKL